MSVSRRSSLSLPATQCRTPRTDGALSRGANSVNAPPVGRRDPTVSTPLDARSLLAAFLLAAVIPTGLFVASRPLVGVVGLATLLGLVAGTRRVVGSLQRVRRDRHFEVDLPGNLSLRVVRHPTERPREERSPEV